MGKNKRTTYQKEYRENYGDYMREQIKEWFRKHPNYLKEWRKTHSNYYQNYRKKNIVKLRIYWKNYKSKTKTVP
jgi:hypothetical protein